MSDADSTCVVCGKTIPTGKLKKFCSAECKVERQRVQLYEYRRKPENRERYRAYEQKINLKRKLRRDIKRRLRIKKRAKQKACEPVSVDYRKEYIKKWKADHRERKIAYDKKRRAIQAGVAIGDMEAITVWIKKVRESWRVSCHWCGKKLAGKNCRFDHVVPLAKGGPEHIDNYCVSCEQCNLKKCAKPPEEFNRELEQPLLFP